MGVHKAVPDEDQDPPGQEARRSAMPGKRRCSRRAGDVRHGRGGAQDRGAALGEGPSGGLGRWIEYMFQGQFTHEDITKAEPIPHEAGM